MDNVLLSCDPVFVEFNLCVFTFKSTFLCREKMKLEQEKTQKEADIKIKNGEVLALQKELDAVSNTVKQLEMQKAEAQKRLDELDDKVCMQVTAVAVEPE